MTAADVQIEVHDPRIAARRETLMAAFRAAAEHHGVPIEWLLAIAHRETRFCNVRSCEGQPDDVRGGAWGPMQVTATTARGMGIAKKLAADQLGPWLLKDPARGIDAGARYIVSLRRALKDQASLTSIAWSYNAGPGACLKGRLPTRTRGYIADVVALSEEYRKLTQQVA